MKRWAMTLRLQPNESLETRLAAVVQYLQRFLGEGPWDVSDLDATGDLGGELTLTLNQTNKIAVSTSDLLRMLREPGNVIELDASLVREGEAALRLIVRDGTSVDILGAADIDLPPAVVGDHVSQDPTLFGW